MMKEGTRTEPKYRILHIGTIETREDGREYGVGWGMDGSQSYASFISLDMETGVEILGGYTVDDLKAIIAAAVE